MIEQKLVRVQENGQVTLPAETRRRLGLKPGDFVAVIDTPDGVLIAPRVAVVVKALDQIGEAIRAAGVSMDELIESGRDERAEIMCEQDGGRPGGRQN